MLLQLAPDAKSSDAHDLLSEVNKAFNLYQETARRVLERFVSVDIGEFARRRVSRKEFEEDDPSEQARVNKLLERLVEVRLLVSDEVGDEAFLELAHDALILGWDRLLTWVREDSSLIADLRRLTPEALKWAGSREASLLWSDAARLDDVRKLQANVSPGLNKTEADFARASVKRARQNSFIRWGLAAVLAIVTAAAIRYATLASDRERIATSRQLASESESAGRQQLDLSLLLGIEAATARPTVEAWSALLGALTEQPRLTAFLHIPNLSAGKYIQSLSFSPDGLQIAAGCLDGSVILWDIKTGRAIEPFLREPEPGSGVVAIAFSPDGQVLAAGTQKGEILFWSVRTHDPLPTLSDSVVKNDDTMYKSVKALVFLDNQQLATGRDNGRVEIWDLKDRKLSRAFGDLISPEENAHRNGVQSLAYDASSGILAAGYGGAVAGFVGPDSSIYLWNSRRNFAPVHSIPAGKGGVRGLTFVPKTSFLTWGRGDGTIGIYDVQKSEELSPLEGGPRSAVTTLASSFDGRFLVSGSLDGSLMIWNFYERKPVDTPIRASGRTIAGVSFSRNGDVVATGGSDGNVALWDIIANGPGERLPESPEGVKMLAGSRSGRWLAGVTYTGNVELWDIVAKSRHQIYKGRDNRAEYVLADGDADAFLIFTSNRAVFRCDSTRCDEDARASELKEPVLPESFSAPGGFEWIERRNSPAELRQCSQNGCVPLTFPDSKPPAVHTISITGDGNKLALAEDYDVYICTKHKCRLVPLKLDWQSSESVGTIAFSPDGQLLILGTGAGHIYFIDTVSGRPLGIPAEAHRGFLEHLAFSADSKIMASGGRDGMVKLWDLNSQRLLGRLALRPAGSTRQVAALTFVSSDGSLAVTYTEDLGPVLLKADLASLVSRACHIANRNLSLAEWGQFLGDASCRSTCGDVVNCRSWLPRPPAPPSANSSDR
ncbi:WD40 repeat domain-containing protein [Mesorhizobium sp. M0663]|uniref:WD40 repeat domain-containing protein n=1 Tax=Mesorhizobium sp. M0663 TaxID=2956981 RepID=UPI00333690B6